MLKQLSLLLALMVCSISVLATDFLPLHSLNELPNSEVRRMFIGHDGRLWIATTGGICFYDGYSYHIYRNSALNPALLSNNNVRSFAEDTQYNVLMATDKGLDVFDQRLGKIWHSRLAQFKNQQVFSIFVSRNGKILVSLPNHLYLYDVTKDKIIREIKYRGCSLIDAKVYEDSHCNLWIGTRNGLYRYDVKNNSFFVFPEFKGKTAAHVISEDCQHRIWIGSFASGLSVIRDPYSINSQRILRITQEDGLQDFCVYAMVEDPHNHRMFVGTSKGLSEVYLEKSRPRIINYTQGGKNPMPFNEVDALVYDGSNSVYVGTLGGGVYRINVKKSPFSHQLIDDALHKLSANSVKSITMIGNKLWMGIGSYGLVTQNVVSQQCDFAGEMPELEKYSPMTTLMAILQMKDGRVMMGSFFRGVYEWSKKGVKVLNCNNTLWLKNDCVYSLAEDRKGNCWIGTFNGLNILDAYGQGRRLKLVAEGKNLSDNMFQSLLVANNGSIWAGTKDAGLLCINPQTMKVDLFCRENGKLCSNDVECLLEDTKKRLWIGTDGGGLCLLDHGKYFFLNKMLDLPIEIVYSILEDNQGRIWAATNSGILCIFLARNISDSLFRLYTDIGCRNNMFLRGSACKSKDGTLYFGGHQGYVFFNPRKLSNLKKQQTVCITDIKIDGQSWFDMEPQLRQRVSSLAPSFAQKIVVDYARNNFAFDFSAMNLDLPMQEKYSYMLEGVDDVWKVSDRYSHSVQYKNVAPGHYRFYLRAMNKNGAWSEKVRVLEVVVSPPIWQTWYAYFIYILLLCVGCWYAYKLISRRMKQKVKQQFFQNITNKMYRPLAVVKGNIDYLASRLPEYSEEFVEMKKNVEKQMLLISMEYKNQLAFELKNVNMLDGDKAFLKHAVACVEKHLDDDSFGVMDMAREMNMGKSTLFKNLKQLTGLNISAFIRKVRLKAACQIMEKNPKTRISDVAYSVGFSSPKYFSQCFKAEFGMLPKDYVLKFAENGVKEE